MRILCEILEESLANHVSFSGLSVGVGIYDVATHKAKGIGCATDCQMQVLHWKRLILEFLNSLVSLRVLNFFQLRRS